MCRRSGRVAASFTNWFVSVLDPAVCHLAEPTAFSTIKAVRRVTHIYILAYLICCVYFEENGSD